MTPDEIRAHVARHGLEHALASLANEVTALRSQVTAANVEIRYLTEAVDTLWSPPWKKAWFWINGWPLYRLADTPSRRPWHRWLRRL